MNNHVTVLPPGAAQTVWVVRDRVSFLGGLPGTSCALLEVEVPPGSGTPPHRHESPEVFRVLDGELRVGLSDGAALREISAPAGTVVHVPSGAVHHYRNASAAPARTLVLADRALEAFFRDLGREERPPGGAPDGQEVAAIRAACARHGIELLEPPGQP